MNFMDQKSNMLLHYSLHEILQNTQICDYTTVNVCGIKYIYIYIWYLKYTLASNTTYSINKLKI